MIISRITYRNLLSLGLLSLSLSRSLARSLSVCLSLSCASGGPPAGRISHAIRSAKFTGQISFRLSPPTVFKRLYLPSFLLQSVSSLDMDMDMDMDTDVNDHLGGKLSRGVGCQREV